MASSIGVSTVEAFDNSIARDFLAFVRSSTHSNRYRMTYSRKALVTAYSEDLPDTLTEQKKFGAMNCNRVPIIHVAILLASYPAAHFSLRGHLAPVA